MRHISVDTSSRTVIPTQFRTTCTSFRHNVHAIYAFCNILESFAKDTFSGKMKFAGTANIL